jgi:nucleoside-diphosphate-sugar epimerase
MQDLNGRKVATVFGGHGFIGRYVVERLAKQDWVVRVASRRPGDASGLASQGGVREQQVSGNRQAEEQADSRTGAEGRTEQSGHSSETGDGSGKQGC